MASDEPTVSKTFEEYSLRFDIEENFLDDPSKGFQLESLLIRSANALITHVHLSAESDPAPAMASKIQHLKNHPGFSSLRSSKMPSPERLEVCQSISDFACPIPQ